MQESGFRVGIGRAAHSETGCQRVHYLWPTNLWIFHPIPARNACTAGPADYKKHGMFMRLIIFNLTVLLRKQNRTTLDITMKNVTRKPRSLSILFLTNKR